MAAAVEVGDFVAIVGADDEEFEDYEFFLMKVTHASHELDRSKKVGEDVYPAGSVVIKGNHYQYDTKRDRGPRSNRVWRLQERRQAYAFSHHLIKVKVEVTEVTNANGRVVPNTVGVSSRLSMLRL